MYKLLAEVEYGSAPLLKYCTLAKCLMLSTTLNNFPFFSHLCNSLSSFNNILDSSVLGFSKLKTSATSGNLSNSHLPSVICLTKFLLVISVASSLSLFIASLLIYCWTNCDALMYKEKGLKYNCLNL